ncbi:MAG: HEAT repeat domain-containing protein [Candidatus Solibacter usitatus]|nr:HEAT repeat domain-containing protein [Candidatus Solibacter usitatus]
MASPEAIGRDAAAVGDSIPCRQRRSGDRLADLEIGPTSGLECLAEPFPFAGRPLIGMLRIGIVVLAAGCVLCAQPKIGLIEVYGLRKVPREKILAALGAKEGSQLPSSKEETEERLEGIDGVVRASLSAVCCEAGKAILYVGIEERGAPRFEFHAPPKGDQRLPEEMLKDWFEFLPAVEAAVRAGNSGEDRSKGYSLMADPTARQIQEKFLTHAEPHYELLREVLKKSSDPEHRGIAAYILGYAKNKRQVADELQYAMRDSDPSVRNNAMRGLSALAILAAQDPDLMIRISYTWFVEMLNSVEFTDRNKAAMTLVEVTEKRDPALLALLRERAVPSLTEMARWRNLGHSLFGFILLGRVAGMTEDEIQELWKKTDRETLLRKVKDSGSKKKS